LPPAVNAAAGVEQQSMEEMASKGRRQLVVFMSGQLLNSMKGAARDQGPQRHI
jgi:hypothetical protein